MNALEGYVIAEIILVLFFASPVFIIIYLLIQHNKAVERQRQINEFLSKFTEMDVVDFLCSRGDFPLIKGVYILHNTEKDLCYVGQSKDVSKRVYNHFSGRGNADVYADYKYGDNFTVQIIPLENTDYVSLNLLERDMIQQYNSYRHGYNRTRGNSAVHVTGTKYYYSNGKRRTETYEYYK